MLMSHQLQQAEYQGRAPSDYIISFTANLHKAVQALRLLSPACDEVLHLRSKDERGSVSIVTKKHNTFINFGSFLCQNAANSCQRTF